MSARSCGVWCGSTGAGGPATCGHGMPVEVDWANEAVRDEHAVRLVPDPATISGHSVPVIGYSGTADAVVTVILVCAEAGPDERPDGDWWGRLDRQ